MADIYCCMEKIVYVYAAEASEKRKGLWQFPAMLLGLPFPVQEKKGKFLEYPVTAYGIGGLSRREAEQLMLLEKPLPREKPVLAEKSTLLERLYRRRFAHTLQKIERKLQRTGIGKNALADVPGLFFQIFCLFGWEPYAYPPELILAFYGGFKKPGGKAAGLQQLIILDGDGALFVAEEIYSTFNYMTVVTGQSEAWAELSDAAYEEYGLSVRCSADDRRLTFREKPALIMDFRKNESVCCQNFPTGSIYMDFCESRSKMHRIRVKCAKIAYVSLHNALDTALRNTV